MRKGTGCQSVRIPRFPQSFGRCEGMGLADSRYFAVIDTETNYDDEVISIGTVIGDAATFSLLDRQYLIIDPECRKPAMFRNELFVSRAKADAITDRKTALDAVQKLLKSYGVTEIFAYNATFDCGHLPEFSGYSWYDIMRLAAYKQYNRSIPETAPLCRTGKLRCGYGAEAIYRMLSQSPRYFEIHNALTDAEDELEIMRMLGQKLPVYDIAKIRPRTGCGCRRPGFLSE